MDNLSKQQRSERMRLVKNKNTRPEITVRRILYSMGYRYRLHASHLPGKPDIIISNRKKAIFVHGCFWHRHPDSKCKLARLPKSRLEIWGAKLEANYKRDVVNQQKLRELGWRLLVVWECQLKDENLLKSTLKAFLQDEID